MECGKEERETISVEVKRFAESDSQRAFAEWARPLAERLRSELRKPDTVQPQIVVVVKDFKRRPVFLEVNAAVRQGLTLCAEGQSIRVQCPSFNVLIESVPKDAVTGLRSHISCVVMSPRADDEVLRVQDRVSDAAKAVARVRRRRKCRSRVSRIERATGHARSCHSSRSTTQRRSLLINLRRSSRSASSLSRAAEKAARRGDCNSVERARRPADALKSRDSHLWNPWRSAGARNSNHSGVSCCNS
jgi:hypothetical protein